MAGNRVASGVPWHPKRGHFHLRFRPLSSSAAHERITQFALQNTGNAERGRELFLNAEKTLCVKCHRLGEQGGNIGPILTGVGSRFSRIHLIESILDGRQSSTLQAEALKGSMPLSWDVQRAKFGR